MADIPSRIRVIPGGVSLALRLTPRGGRDALEGWEKDASGRAFLKARVRVAPEDGRANDALVELLTDVLDVPRSDVAISSGAKARRKIVTIKGDPGLLTKLLEQGGSEA